ncbi:INSIG family protein [Wickerhamiella sorbophila]|uniref:INSIG family protein n=1 Tax=Wickerhamiella sorbophila TaxID=45607 RepID=A0A2T0FLB2_9ASCO|nr:INSIG family protein [Wickerhamiella sorbophila]PRT55783.1 INSIG family protein [Wickerhamiella sorbophila]
MSEAVNKDADFHSSSALQNVFGSRVSLAELNGDITSRMNSRAPSPKPESWSAHRRTHRAKTRSMSMSRPGSHHFPHPGSLSFVQILSRAVVLFALGAAYGWYHTTQIPMAVPLAIPLQVNGRLLSVAGLSAIILGLVLPVVDYIMPVAFRSQSKGAKAGKDWLSIVRALGAFLGMMYAVSKLQIATIFWCLASPFLWFVLDGSPNGLIAATGTAVGGPLLMYLTFPESFTAMPGRDITQVLWWLAASYFSASIFFGNLGRRLFPLPIVAGP